MTALSILTVNGPYLDYITYYASNPPCSSSSAAAIVNTMSIVIPASQLRHAIITVRCENTRSAPQIECAFDDQLPPGLSSYTDKGASFTFSSEGKITPSVNSSSALDGENARQDLSIERGQDQRGHFVRLSFSPPPRPALGVLSGIDSGLVSSSTEMIPTGDRQSTPRQATPMQSTMPKYSTYDMTGITQIANVSGNLYFALPQFLKSKPPRTPTHRYKPETR